MEATLLVELLTEELPPKSLRELSESFARELHSGLETERLLSTQSAARAYATPRRLAALITAVKDRAPDLEREVQGPSIGAPAQAVAGFARKSGVAVEALRRGQTPKGEVHVALLKTTGKALDTFIVAAVESAVRALPISKVMRWGDGEAQFVRPVHGLVMLHGAREIPGTVLGVAASSTTRGHRFMGARSIALKNADEYEARLRDDGMVIADFASRRAAIEQQLAAEAKRQGASLGDHEGLLDEVTALVEHPTVYAGAFDPAFLELPQECLILTMRQNQKYFPLFDAAGKLLPKFLLVSNMRVADARHIIGGNERVVGPRIEDARFFYQQDRKLRLEERVPRLAKVVYHNKLGSQLERVGRMQLLAGRIARELGANAALAERAAWLAKADLVTGMVGEFPELQGIMGRYYALHDGEPREVADAIEAHYRPRFSGDRLPEGAVSCAVALADKLDALTGMFGIGQQPSGDKDPFGLRRAALGVIRILVERRLELSLFDLLNAAFEGYRGIAKLGDARAELEAFIFERMRSYSLDQGFTANEVEAVLCMRPARMDLVPRQLEAVRTFMSLPESQSLAAANKRIANILKQADRVPSDFDSTLLVQPEEKVLAATYALLRPNVEGAIRSLDFTRALQILAALKEPVDAFFDNVMVMDKDAKLRSNRVGFLGRLHATMNQVADLSKLAA